MNGTAFVTVQGETIASPISVLAVEDHPLYRFALEQALEGDPGIEFAGCCGDGAEALVALDEIEVDILLLDLRLPRVDGFAVLDALADRNWPGRVLVLSGDSDPALARDALRRGAAGFLVKDVDQDGLRRAVAAAARGEIVLPRRLQHALLRLHADPEANVCPLTDREQEVLALTAAGLSRRAVGSQLFISQATVKVHLSSLYRKLGVSDRAAAVAQGMRLGLLDSALGAGGYGRGEPVVQGTGDQRAQRPRAAVTKCD